MRSWLATYIAAYKIAATIKFTWLHIYTCSLSGLTVTIDVDYTPPSDFVGGPTDYRAASSVTLTCRVEGGYWGRDISVVIHLYWSWIQLFCACQDISVMHSDYPSIH